jgi:NAD+ kinase
MKRIFIVANAKRKPELASLLRRTEPWLRRVGRIVGKDLRGHHDLSGVRADLMLVFGGDGTMLAAARALRGNPVPVLGVNMGQLGFLSELGYPELKLVLPEVLNGDYMLSPRMMIEARVMRPGGALGPAIPALNDAVVLRMPKATLMTVGVSVSGEEVARYRGDGLIVSTATGSTGYSLSAGGPILSERLKAFIVVPVCPHTLANRPIVLSGDERIEVRPETRRGESLEVVLDGQVSRRVTSGTRIVIQKAPYEFNIASLGRKGRYEIIRDKLHWAGWVKERGQE